jgi:hypothetical protein
MSNGIPPIVIPTHASSQMQGLMAQLRQAGPNLSTEELRDAYARSCTNGVPNPQKAVEIASATQASKTPLI